MAEKRLRKRITRQSESDPTSFHGEPPKKRSKKQDPPSVENPSLKLPKKRQRNGRFTKATSSPSSVRSAVSGMTEKPGPRTRRQLLISLNIQENDLHVSRQVKREGVGRGTARAKGQGKGAGRGARQVVTSARQLLQPQLPQRGQSVGSDGGSSNGSNGGNGRNLTFKNQSFTVIN